MGLLARCDPCAMHRPPIDPALMPHVPGPGRPAPSGFEFAGFRRFELVLRQLGGIASRRELLDATDGDETAFWFAVRYGYIDRVRNGWYAAATVPADARAAWAAGGPLACVSALVHHGMLEPVVLPVDGPLHIAVGRGGHRFPVSRAVVAHWGDQDRESGTRLAVSPEVALRQARRCASAHQWPRSRGLSPWSSTTVEV